MSMLLEMLSRCPLYLSHGPAMEMWSVVHLPLALISTMASWILPPMGLKGSKICNRLLSGATATSKSPSGFGAWYVSSPTRLDRRYAGCKNREG